MQKHALPRPNWHTLIGALVVSVISLVSYLQTAAPDLCWAHASADGGDLIAAAMTWGVPHPSGYPAYTLLARTFAQAIPIQPLARRFNLFSSVCAALAVGLTYTWIRALLEDWIAGDWLSTVSATGGALAWALGPLLWQQAVITEVYALQALFIAAAFNLTVRLSVSRASCLATWTSLGLILGAGLGAHLTTLLCWPGIGLILWQRRARNRVIALIAGLLAGSLVMLYLPLAARQHPPVSWGDASTLSGFWWLVSGRLYQGYLMGLPLASLPGRLAAWAAMWRQQFTLIGMLLIAGGLGSLAESEKPWLSATLVTVMLYSILAITYDTADSHVYLIPAMAVGASWAALGLTWFGQWIRDSVPSRFGTLQERYRLSCLCTALLATSITLWLGSTGLQANDVSQNSKAADWIATTLCQLPEDAMLITSQDRHTFALDYAQWAVGTRHDVVVVDADLIGYAWYQSQLATRHPDLDLNFIRTDWHRWLVAQSNERPIYLASPRSDLESRFLTTPEGTLLRLSAVR